MASLNVYRTLMNELRLASPNGTLKKDSLAVRYVASQYRKYKTTDETLCKAKQEMEFLGKTYACYLQSLRKQEAIIKDYRGSGERTVEATADMVGFKLPHDTQHKTD